DGADSLNGVGSVRRLGPAPLGTEETVTESVDNELITYKITRNGGPISNHSGRLEFRSTPTGSEVRWQIAFDSPIPLAGPVLRNVLATAIRSGLKRIA
ncbi:MAG: SRPBCC family protein, partial [Oceanococcaceae bacterium]